MKIIKRGIVVEFSPSILLSLNDGYPASNHSHVEIWDDFRDELSNKEDESMVTFEFRMDGGSWVTRRLRRRGDVMIVNEVRL